MTTNIWVPSLSQIITVVKDPKGENFSFNKPQATSTALNSTPSELRNEINKLKAQLEQVCVRACVHACVRVCVVMFVVYVCNCNRLSDKGQSS